MVLRYLRFQKLREKRAVTIRSQLSSKRITADLFPQGDISAAWVADMLQPTESATIVNLQTARTVDKVALPKQVHPPAWYYHQTQLMLLEAAKKAKDERGALLSPEQFNTRGLTATLASCSAVAIVAFGGFSEAYSVLIKTVPGYISFLSVTCAICIHVAL